MEQTQTVLQFSGSCIPCGFCCVANCMFQASTAQLLEEKVSRVTVCPSFIASDCKPVPFSGPLCRGHRGASAPPPLCWNYSAQKLPLTETSLSHYLSTIYLMVDLQSVAVVAGVAAMTSLVTIASAASLLALWKGSRSDSTTPIPCGITRQRSSATKTPEPGSSGAHQQQQPGGLFSPVNKQKRPDPYDPKPRNA